MNSSGVDWATCVTASFWRRAAGSPEPVADGVDAELDGEKGREGDVGHVLGVIDPAGLGLQAVDDEGEQDEGAPEVLARGVGVEGPGGGADALKPALWAVSDLRVLPGLVGDMQDPRHAIGLGVHPQKVCPAAVEALLYGVDGKGIRFGHFLDNNFFISC